MKYVCSVQWPSQTNQHTYHLTSLAYSVCGGNAVGLLGSLQAQCVVQNCNCGVEQAGSSTSLLIGLKGHTL